tara:strand:+ start:173 stop:826 length:654 start_codon:yes stop_codon:yes gene_type:complete
MKNIYSILILFSFGLNAQTLSVDSTQVDNNFLNEINKIKISNDSVISNFENFKYSSNKKLNDVKIFSRSLNDIIELNYVKNKSISDSLLNNDELLTSKINENIKHLEKQAIILIKNKDSFLNLQKTAKKVRILTILFLIIIFACLLFIGVYFKNQKQKIKLEYDLKLNNLLSDQRNLNKEILSISTFSDKLKVQNETLSKNLKGLSQDIKKIKSTLE